MIIVYLAILCELMLRRLHRPSQLFKKCIFLKTGLATLFLKAPAALMLDYWLETLNRWSPLKRSHFGSPASLQYQQVRIKTCLYKLLIKVNHRRTKIIPKFTLLKEAIHIKKPRDGRVA